MNMNKTKLIDILDVDARIIAYYLAEDMAGREEWD